MARKPIAEETQKRILLRSRRRCCLCFWLDGRDEVQKGQIAHLDGDNENAAEDNLAFLCFDHHDDYDGTTRLAKGLKENEVKHWRDELYKEIEYRFKTITRSGFELSITGFRWIGPDDQIKAIFRLKNTGEAAARSPEVAIRLPSNVLGTLPRQYDSFKSGLMKVSMPVIDPWAMHESQQDIFEPGGRVAVKSMGGMNPILMPDHSFQFEGLVFRFSTLPPGSVLELEYRVAAEGVAPVRGKLKSTIPSTPEEMFEEDDQ